ncbi:nucleotide-binding protein [Microbacterium sp. LWO13-1.2]|uniref:nucleotide-binding protein n=1 Tax=Microbacterium sp. LWO13-1.2 TaxID=3135262 RepID=UPI0031387030
MTNEPLPRVFIGASSEAKFVADTLQVLLQGYAKCDPVVWDQGTFGLTKGFLDSLINAAEAADFAVLVATQDDALANQERMAPRDNVMLELGLFIGALGRDRALLVADHSANGIKLPTDMNGITHAPYFLDGSRNLKAALTRAALDITEHIVEVGPRKRMPVRSGTIPTPPRQPIAAPARPNPVTHSLADHVERLHWELQSVARSAQAQGWKVKQSETTLRLVDPHRKRFAFSITGHPRQARSKLRDFAAELRANGLRVNRVVREPLESAISIVTG